MVQALQQHGISDVTLDAPLADHNSYRVGGRAAALVCPNSIAEVAATLRVLAENGTRYAVIGWGSNLICSDDGFDGVVIKLGEGLRYVEPLGLGGEQGAASQRVRVGAATMNNHLVRELHKAGLSGAECLALVPGTFGGAVAMNAGTRAGEVKDIVESVTVVLPSGDIQELDAADLGFRYRHADVPRGAIVVEGVIRAAVGGVEAGREQVKEERAYRNRTQPYSLPSAGSVFRNPEGDHAGRLIEAAGLKGTRIGGAVISMLHANFIVTETGAKAADVVALMELARRTVREQFGVELRAEQRLLGFAEGVER